MTRGVETGARGAAAGPPGHGDRHRRSSGRRPSSRCRSTTSPRRCCWAALLVVIVLALFLFEWRAALISVVAIPLSLIGGGAGALPARHDDQHDGAGRAGDRRSAWSSTTRSSTSRTSCAGCARHRTGGRRQVDGERSSSTPRSRCAAPIVYATLIIIAALAAGVLPRGPDRRLLPAAGPLLRAGGARVDGGRADRHAGAESHPAAERAARAPRVAARRAGCSAGYERVLARIITQAVAGVRRRSALAVAAGRRRGAAASGSRCCPSFKERDFLMHWLTKPGTSQPEEARVSIRGQPRSCATIPGVRNCGSHIGQAFLVGRAVGINFGENWISVDPKVDYDETLASVQEVVDGYPGSSRDVQTYLKERIREVLTGSSDADRRAHLRRRPRTSCAEKADEVKELIGEHRRARRGERGAADRRPAGRGRGRPGQGPALRAQARRRAARRRPRWMAGEEVGDVFRGGKAYDVHVWSTPETRNSLTSIQRAADRHARAAAGAAGRGGRRAHRADAELDRARERSRAGSTSAPTCSGRDLGSPWRTTSRTGSRRSTFPLGYHAELLGRVRRSGRRPSAGCWSTASWPRSRSSCSCRPRSGAGGWRRCRS